MNEILKKSNSQTSFFALIKIDRLFKGNLKQSTLRCLRVFKRFNFPVGMCYYLFIYLLKCSYRAFVLLAVGKISRGGEFLTNNNSWAEKKRLSNAHNATGCVIQRQWCVENVVRLKIGHVVNAGRNENISVRQCSDKNTVLLLEPKSFNPKNAKYLECVITAAFGRPVVPDV